MLSNFFILIYYLYPCFHLYLNLQKIIVKCVSLLFIALLFEYGFGNLFLGLGMLALPLLPAWLFIQPKLEDWWYSTYNTFDVPTWKWWAVWSAVSWRFVILF